MNDLVLNAGCGDDPRGDIRLDITRTRATNIIADAHCLPFRDNVFSRIYERNLLEHLHSPGMHLAEIFRVLRKHGILDLVTDNAACLKYYLLGTHTGGYHGRHEQDRHFGVFTREHIKNLLECMGFTGIKISLISTEHPSRVFDLIMRLVLPELSKPRIRAIAYKP